MASTPNTHERMVLRVPVQVKRQMQKLAIDADSSLQDYATQVFKNHIAEEAHKKGEPS